MTFPTLYKKTSSGSIQQWHVTYENDKVIVQYGQVFSPNIQTTTETVVGLNVGKSNETTSQEQAIIRAKQLYDAKIKKGYVPDLSQATVTDNALDGVLPMLAFPLEKKEKHVIFPAFVQPKLDGQRTLGVIKDGKCTLYSRTQKVINTVPHINLALEEFVIKNPEYLNIVLDGELYNHELKHDFNRLMSIIKRDDIHPEHELIQYHIYDVVDNKPYKDRDFPIIRSNSIKNVETRKVNDYNEMMVFFYGCLELGYEGAMYRNPNMVYEHKRSIGLLKIKEMQDAEFKIIGVNEGKGKLEGKAGSFTCLTPEGKTFDVKLQGAIEDLTEYLINFNKYNGKLLTVKFQGLTPDRIPRFPVGIRIRVEE